MPISSLMNADWVLADVNSVQSDVLEWVVGRVTVLESQCPDIHLRPRHA